MNFANNMIVIKIKINNAFQHILNAKAQYKHDERLINYSFDYQPLHWNKRIAQYRTIVISYTINSRNLNSFISIAYFQLCRSDPAKVIKKKKK